MTSIMHLLVDFICVSTLMYSYYDSFGNSFFIYVFLIYNCIAFLTQPFIGLWLDKVNETYFMKAMMIFSAVFVIIGSNLLIAFGVIPTFSIIGTLLLGLGNSLFHVVGGKEITSTSNKSTPGGLFVSTGAIGVGLGMLFNQRLLFVPALILVIAPFIYGILSVVHIFIKNDNYKLNYEPIKQSPKILVAIALILCIAVGIRSFVGFYATYSNNLKGAPLILLLSICAFLGKAIGGILLDLVGPYVTISISTILGAVAGLLLKFITFDYIFVFSINLLMPLTLDLIRRIFPKHEGFSFGLLAAFLVPGYLLGHLMNEYSIYDFSWILILLTGGMLIAIYLINRKNKCVQ